VNDLIDLASARLGGVVLNASDEFFAPKDRLIFPAAPIWHDGEYTDRGKWMDGWESQRRRDVLPGDAGFSQAHDWCIVRLGTRGVIRRIDVETTHFKGNHPESCAVDASVVSGEEIARAPWQPAIERSPLVGDSHNVFEAAHVAATHVRLRIFPDGGVARLRVYGDVLPDWDALRRQGEVDLASVLHGGRVIECSDMFFSPRHNLIMPGDAIGMADGWETRRRRAPGHEWTVIKLGAPGTIARVDVDTTHFKGNAPAACSLEASTSGAADWRELLPRTPLDADRRHTFETAAPRTGGVTHVRLNIFPDGGIARLRLFGTPA
jgi:allantoicase